MMKTTKIFLEVVVKVVKMFIGRKNVDDDDDRDFCGSDDDENP